MLSCQEKNIREEAERTVGDKRLRKGEREDGKKDKMMAIEGIEKW